MGILIGCEHVSHEWPGKRVLADQTIGINEGDRIGIVGRNGDGKSTLVSLISHQLEPDSGQVVWRNGITVGTLAQTDSLADDDTVRHGRVAGLGPHARLVKSCPLYREICLSQLKPEEVDA